MLARYCVLYYCVMGMGVADDIVVLLMMRVNAYTLLWLAMRVVGDDW